MDIVEEPNDSILEHSMLERSAILALCKILCVSGKLCDENVQLIFDLLERVSLDPITKCNIVVSIGDLYQRHANKIEVHIKKLYSLLRTKV